MEDYSNLPTVTPPEALEIISSSPLSRAQKLLSASLVTQAIVRTYHYPETHEEVLVLNVAHFLNHRINTRLMDAVGEELAEAISLFNPELILTAPSLGNISAIATATHLSNKPDIIYAPKGLPNSITPENTYQQKSHSYAYGTMVDMTVAKDCLPVGSKVAICDDFLDSGRTIKNLLTIINEAQARTAVAFFVIEKPYSGRQNLIDAGLTNEQILALIKIDAMQSGKIKIAGFDYWFQMIRQ